MLSYKAVADCDEENRNQGEALDPDRWPISELMNRKKAMSDYTWAAMFNQSPVVAGGALIQGEWFGNYSTIPDLRKIIITADTANKTGEHNDYSVFLLSGLGVDGRVYLLDMLRGKWEAPELLRQASAFYHKHSPLRIAEIYIEDAQSGTTLIQTLSRTLHSTIKPIRRTKDKFTRLNGVVAEISQNKIVLPSTTITNRNQTVTSAAWVSDFLIECENFTAEMSHAHDDQVDTLIDAIELLLLKQQEGGNLARGLY